MRLMRFGVGAAALCGLAATAWGGPDCGPKESCGHASHAGSCAEPEALSEELRSIADRMPAHPHGSCWSEQQIRAFDAIEFAAFHTLPQLERERIASMTLDRSEAERLAPIAAMGMKVRYEDVAHLTTPETFVKMSPVLRHMLHTLDRNNATAIAPTALCFAPGTDMEIAEAFDQTLTSYLDRFQQTTRWAQTASSPAGSQGTPTTLTWGYANEGTFVTNTVGYSGNNNLFAWLNGIYGSQAVWHPLFVQVFDRWGELSGVTYIYEPNDDGGPSGTTLDNFPGVLGVRADLRIAAIGLDGNGGVLAYNNFPQNGDMVFDSADNFYNTTTNNSLRLRNIIAHEHGHGMGQLHVCPANETKLMEPFISTAYDGPQYDDMLNAQRHYGDFYEPNDTVGSATNLGSIGVSSSINIGQRGSVGTILDPIPSIDDNSDRDYYRLTLNQPMQLSVTITPEGFAYQDGPQTFNCGSGPTVDYLTIHDLAVRYRTTGGTILQTEDSGGLGDPETITRSFGAGDIIFEVYPATSTNNIQAYTINIVTTPPPFLAPEIIPIDPLPTQLDPAQQESFLVSVDPRDDVIVPGTILLNYAPDGMNFVTAPLSSLGGNVYEATLPGFACADAPSYYISAVGQTAGLVRFPPASSGDLDAVVGEFVTIFADNFETNQGWTVTNSPSLTDGAWERGVPVGGGVRGDPPTDADGSGQCYLTANRAGNSDVDGGSTTLTSPLIDASGSNVVLSYYVWYSNDFGANPNVDTFVVEATGNNGGLWFPINIIGPSGPETAGGWFQYFFELDSILINTNQFRVRFTASDPDPTGSVVEAGVDGVVITRLACEDPTPPPANDLCSGAIALPIGSSVMGDTSAATVPSPALSDCMPADQFPGDINAPTVWYSFVGNGNDIVLSTCDSAAYDTAISVYCQGCAVLTCVAGNDDAAGCSGFTSTVVVPTRNNAQYLVAVHGWEPVASGAFTLSSSDTGVASVDALVACGGDDPAPLSCNPADLNTSTASNPAAPNWGVPDGILTPTDFSAFVTFFGAGDLRADINSASATSPASPNFGVPDGILTPTDFSAFVAYFNAGCPCTLPGCP